MAFWLNLEGPDRVGKTTQCQLLAERLQARGIQVRVFRVPDRTNQTGQIIHEYLQGNGSAIELRQLHLVFTLNRWEIMREIERCLEAGIWVITDRWSASGIAYSVARGLPMDWCSKVEEGLPQPNMTFYLDANPVELQEREGWGQEREETLDMQMRVQEAYHMYFDGMGRGVVLPFAIQAYESPQQIQQRLFDSLPL